MSKNSPNTHERPTEGLQPREGYYDYSVYRGLPPPIILHQIDDAELEGLEKGSKPMISGVALSCMGIFFGAIVPGSAGFANLNSGASLSWPEKVSMFVTVGALVGVVIAGPIAWSLRRERKKIVERVRSRARTSIATGQAELPASGTTRNP